MSKRLIFGTAALSAVIFLILHFILIYSPHVSVAGRESSHSDWIYPWQTKSYDLEKGETMALVIYIPEEWQIEAPDGCQTIQNVKYREYEGGIGTQELREITAESTGCTITVHR